jgi:excinuclease UvrABC nuclease subunit
MSQNTNILFPAQPLLPERIGRSWFDDIPPTPGIYTFFDEYGKLLYVGKAKNLRLRLFSYKRAKPGEVSRKVARLIAKTSGIEYEETDSELEALLCENRMIREHRPPFNHANKQPEAYYFVFLKTDESGLEYRLAMRIHDETDQNCWHGCFKGHNIVRRSMGCMLQLLWMAEHQHTSPHLLPIQLTRRLTPTRFSMKWKNSVTPGYREEITQLLNRWMTGASCELLDWLAINIEHGSQKHISRFEALFLENRLECLKAFFDYKLVKYRQLRESQPEKRRLIAQNELDDLMVRARF